MVNFISISLLIIFVLWLNYEIGKNNRLSNKSKDEFWKKESQANTTRKVDISGLDYISIPLDRLPMEDNPDKTINSYRNTILSHSDKKILNLSGFSNTELKLKYGAANINLLSEYDNNYTVLVSILHKWGERLYINDYLKEALAVLEVALDCKTDNHKTFELLAEIYKKQGSYYKIDLLMDRLSSAPVRDKKALLLKLQEFKART
ncbi:MAG: hypothetical protein EWM47_04330 [Anaerolineaceae bacterium]|nr:MAG: hypothetical protein EWM47_04330 [Anaerolineaceae bacterium]